MPAIPAGSASMAARASFKADVADNVDVFFPEVPVTTGAVFRNCRAIAAAGLSEVSTATDADIDQVAGIIYGDLRRNMPEWYIRWLNTDFEDDPIVVPLDLLINFPGALNFTAPVGAGPFPGPTVVSYALPVGFAHAEWIINSSVAAAVTLDGAPSTASIVLGDGTVNYHFSVAAVPSTAPVIVVTAPTLIVATAFARGTPPDSTLFVGKSDAFTVTP